jgi:exonuclease SbcC
MVGIPANPHIVAFKPDREKLGRALSAASLDGAYATLTATRKQQGDDRAGLKSEEEALPGLESSAKEQAEALKLAEKQTTRAKEELKAAAPTLLKVRSLDQTLADQKKAVTEGDEGSKKAAAKIDADKKTGSKSRKNDPRLMRRWILWTAISWNMHRMNG